MRKRLLVMLFCFWIKSVLSAQNVLTVNGDKPGVWVNPHMYGIFLKKLIMAVTEDFMLN